MSLLEEDPYVGNHCESTTLVNLLRQREVDLSESLIFGLAGGLSFIYWRTKQMPTPFVGGRIKPDTLSENLANALKLRLSVHETSSVKRAKEHLLAELESEPLSVSSSTAISSTTPPTTSGSRPTTSPASATTTTVSLWSKPSRSACNGPRRNPSRQRGTPGAR